jgi:hypothetical protein
MALKFNKELADLYKEVSGNVIRNIPGRTEYVIHTRNDIEIGTFSKWTTMMLYINGYLDHRASINGQAYHNQKVYNTTTGEWEDAETK